MQLLLVEIQIAPTTFHLDLMGRDLRAQKCQFLRGKTQIKTSSQNLTDIFLAFEVSSMA